MFHVSDVPHVVTVWETSEPQLISNVVMTPEAQNLETRTSPIEQDAEKTIVAIALKSAVKSTDR